MSRLRRPFLSDRYFFLTVRLLKERARLHDADFHLMALALNRVRRQHPLYLAAWVFLPDHWYAICAPVYPLTISGVMKSTKTSSAILINRRRPERRARLFGSDRFRSHFVQTLAQLRQQQNFRLLGCVLMPEHFHLLL